MATPALQGTPTSAEQTTPLTSVSVSKPAGTAVGEILILCSKWENNADSVFGGSVSASGTTWSAVTNIGTNACHIHLWERVVDGTEDATFTVDYTPDPTRRIGAICFRIAATNGCELNTSAISSLAGATPVALPEATTTAADCLVVAFVGSRGGNIADPSGGVYTDIVLAPQSRLGAWGKNQASAGSTGTTETVTAGTTSTERISLIVAAWNEVAGGTDVNPAATVVTVVTATGNVTGEATVAPASSVVTVVAATAGVAGQTDVAAASTIVTTVAATAGVTGHATVTPVATTVITVAATGDVAAQADVTPSSTVVTIAAAIGDVEQTVTVEPAATVVTVHAGTADVTGHATITPTATVVTIAAAVGQLAAQADITPTPSIVTVVAATANIGGQAVAIATITTTITTPTNVTTISRATASTRIDTAVAAFAITPGD